MAVNQSMKLMLYGLIMLLIPFRVYSDGFSTSENVCHPEMEFLSTKKISNIIYVSGKGFYIARQDGYILNSYDGSRWEVLSKLKTDFINGVESFAWDGQYFYAYIYGKTYLYRSKNANEWRTIDIDLDNYTGIDYVFLSNQKSIVITPEIISESVGPKYSENNGDSWTDAQGLHRLNQAKMSLIDNNYYIITVHKLWESSDGYNWLSRELSGINESGVVIGKSKNYILVNTNGDIYHSHDLTNWEEAEIEYKNILLRGGVSFQNKYFVYGNCGVVTVSDDMIHWQMQDMPKFINFVSAASSPTEILIGGYEYATSGKRHALYSSNDGLMWKNISDDIDNAIQIYNKEPTEKGVTVPSSIENP